MSNLRVLIVGSSIAGPTAAYWFAKAGAKVTVIERFPGLRTNGQAIDIRTAGVTVMRKMPGMEEAVRAKRAPMHGISFVREDGRPFATIIPTGNPDQQSLVSEYEIYRGDLSKIIFDLTKDNKNVKYVFGEQVTAIHQNEKENGPVSVEFENGYPTSDYDLVVACDGATSRTRTLGLDSGLRDHIKPVNCWAAWFTIDEDLTDGAKYGQAYSAVGGRFVACGRDPKDGSNRVTLMGMYPQGDPDATVPFRMAAKRGDQGIKEFIAQHFKGAGWKTDGLVEAMFRSRDFYATEVFQVKLPSLHKGRFVMVGDAGYAPGPTGGGTTLAIAGAYLLAGEICKHKGDLEAGLQGYEQRMKPLINDLQKIPMLFPSALAPQTLWGIWLRNNIMGFVVGTGFLSFAQRYIAGAFTRSNKHPVPEYDWVD